MSSKGKRQVGPQRQGPCRQVSQRTWFALAKQLLLRGCEMCPGLKKTHIVLCHYVAFKYRHY